MREIAISPSMSDYFRSIVSEALEARRVAASEAAAGYLVSLLCDFAHPDAETESTLSQPLTFLLRDALDARGAERFRRLRTLGDGVLYVVSFFGGHLSVRGADRSYVMGVGTTAYDQASAMLRLGGFGAAGFLRSKQLGLEPESVTRSPDVLGELAGKFETFVDVLSDVADGTMAAAARDDRAVLKLYERWLKTGSTRLAAELGMQGLVPARGSGGLN